MHSTEGAETSQGTDRFIRGAALCAHSTVHQATAVDKLEMPGILKDRKPAAFRRGSLQQERGAMQAAGITCPQHDFPCRGRTGIVESPVV